jgi:RNA polymerase sigma factor (sigma-70 family)
VIPKGRREHEEAVTALAQDVLQRAQASDAAAVDAVARLALPRVLRWCARMGGPKVDHEDAAHDVLLVVLRQLPQLGRVEQFDSWLFSITRRVLAGHRRRAWVRRWVPGLHIDAPDGASSPHRLTEQGQLAHKVREALDVLPAAQREVLILCDLEGRTCAEAASMVGCPEGTVKSRLRLGRAAFSRAARARGLADLALENG